MAEAHQVPDSGHFRLAEREVLWLLKSATAKNTRFVLNKGGYSVYREEASLQILRFERLLTEADREHFFEGEIRYQDQSLRIVGFAKWDDESRLFVMQFKVLGNR